MARVVSGEPIRLHELEAEVRQAAGRLFEPAAVVGDVGVADGKEGVTFG